MPAAVARARSEEKRRIACPRPRSTHRKPSSQPSSRCDSSRFSAASNASATSAISRAHSRGLGVEARRRVTKAKGA